MFESFEIRYFCKRNFFDASSDPWIYLVNVNYTHSLRSCTNKRIDPGLVPVRTLNSDECCCLLLLRPNFCLYNSVFGIV